LIESGVADPRFVSRILIFSIRIPGPQQQKGLKKNFFVLPLFVAINFTKKVILLLNRFRKKFEPTDKELKYYLPKRVSLSSQKYGLRIRDTQKTYPGFRIQG
jgi:hypothetical protein